MAKYLVVRVSETTIEVSYKCPINKKKTNVEIPDTIQLTNGKKAKVVAIEKNAFKNNKNLKKITIGKNVKKIGTKAFYGCKNLKKIIIKTTMLTKKNIGSKAFKGVHSKAVILVPKKKVSSYKKILKTKGIGSGVKITK